MLLVVWILRARWLWSWECRARAANGLVSKKPGGKESRLMTVFWLPWKTKAFALKPRTRWPQRRHVWGLSLTLCQTTQPVLCWRATPRLSTWGLSSQWQGGNFCKGGWGGRQLHQMPRVYIPADVAGTPPQWVGLGPTQLPPQGASISTEEWLVPQAINWDPTWSDTK